MYRICKDFTFSAAHYLEGLPEEHPCSRPHGHNYKVRVCLSRARLDSVGFVVDYGELNAFKEQLDALCDHRDLNDVYTFNPTAENLAKHFYDWCKMRWAETEFVGVSETDKTWAFFGES